MWRMISKTRSYNSNTHRAEPASMTRPRQKHRPKPEFMTEVRKGLEVFLS